MSGNWHKIAKAFFFQYERNYLTTFGNLSPFQLTGSTELQQAPLTPHQGLHGVFADSLPDGWGLLLQDRIFRQHDILPMQITAMDRLAFVGEDGMGALSYTPISEYSQNKQESDLARLGTEAQRILCLVSSNLNFFQDKSMRLI